MRAQALNLEVQQLREQIAANEKRLSELGKNCVDNRGHDWGDVRFDPQYREGYTIPGDLERGIYVGVDTRVSSIYVPPETTRQWVRQCVKCGVEQRTEKTREVTRSGAIAGTVAVEQVPVFPESERRM